MRFAINYEPANHDEICGESLAQLRAHLAGIEEKSSIQVAIDKENGEGLNACFNPNRAWVTWVNEDGDWAYPVNPVSRESDDVVEECYIENGQLDEYSIRWSITKQEAVRILLHYLEYGTLADWIEWTDKDYWAR